MLTTPKSPLRREFRILLADVVQAHTAKPVQLLHPHDLALLRREFRKVVPLFKSSPPYQWRVWRQEVRNALGLPVSKPRRHHPKRLLTENQVMPSMRAWAIRQGLIQKAPAN